MSSNKSIAAAEANGWVIECESPLELRHSESGSFASGIAAELVLEHCEKDSCDSEQEEIWTALLSLQHKANIIARQQYGWEMKYDLIFTPGLSRRVFNLFSDLGIRLDYYDPDTSYEEDVLAFVSAFNSKMEELAPTMLFK